MHAQSGNPAALKILKDAARYTEAARAAKNLRHSNIVRCLGGGRVGRIVTLAYELIDGTPFDALPRSTLRDRVRMIESAARAVEYARSQGVEHGNLKPSNILIDGDGTVKVTDFGLKPIGEPAPSDVYALGMMLHESSRATMPPDLKAVVAHAIAGRYASAGALADDLEAYLAGRPVSATPPSNRTLAIAIAGVILALAAIAIFLATR